MNPYQQKPRALALLGLILLPGLAAAQETAAPEKGTPFSIETCKGLFTEATATLDMAQSQAIQRRVVQNRATSGASDLSPLVTTSATLIANNANGHSVLTFSNKESTVKASTLN